MKIDRRSFLSLGIGVAAGTALSPLPWKITDDLSIWTQQWPWTPAPEDGKATYVNSVCRLCPEGCCGITVRKIDDRAVKIEGMKGHPKNNGGICILGLSGLQLLYGPTRIKTPLKRVGQKGEGRFQAFSWEQALKELSAKLGPMRSKGNPDGLACISGRSTGTVALLLKRFLHAYGSPNFMHAQSMNDAYDAVVKMMHGTDSTVGIDIENADYVLSFSCGILDGWGSSVRMAKARAALKASKGKLVQCEPRMSNTAAKADQWVPITPGTEAVLAMGIIGVILQESLYDKAFVEYHINGFEEFKEQVLKAYPVDKVSQDTGVDASVIMALAKDFSQAAAPLAICGRGQGDGPGSLSEFAAVHALNALVGNIDQKGGVFTLPRPDYIQWPEPGLDPIALRGLEQKRIDGAANTSGDDSSLQKFIETMNRIGQQGVEILFVSEADPVFTLKDSEAVKHAFEKIGLVVNFSSYMDDTGLYSDLILPNHVYLERYEDTCDSSALFLGLSKPVVAPLYDTRYTGDVVLQIAGSLGGIVGAAFPWPSYESCLRQTLGYRWHALIKNGYWINRSYTPPAWIDAFSGLPRKINFSCTGLKQAVYTPPEGDAGTYPLVLIPYDSIRIANDHIATPPFMTKTLPDTVLKGKDGFVEINPKTAKQLMLVEGKAARLTTPKGQARVRVHLSEGIGPGIIAMPRGLGHTAADLCLKGKGVNVNSLIGPVRDPVSGLDASWGIRAKLVKI
jgi:menaquinone reductase, molybdopterin-binding-like subunit